MLICASKCCTHNKDRACTLDIIRVSSGGMCEQCSIEKDFAAETFQRKVVQLMQKQSELPEHKATRSGGTFPSHTLT